MLATIIACCLLPAVARSAPAASDDESPTTAPGLVATFSLGLKPSRMHYPFPAIFPDALFSRYESSPTLLLAPGESPDPCLPAAGWKRSGTACLLRATRPGKYRFSAIHSGRLLITVAGHIVLDEPATRKQPAQAEVSLPFGQ